MLDEGNKRTVVFPKGKWKADEGSIIMGLATKLIEVVSERLTYFELLEE
jgi:hypothetical protein